MLQDYSNAQRCIVIDHLVELCEPTQVRHMMQLIEPQFQRDFISLLPREVSHIKFVQYYIKYNFYLAVF